jgi:hypothetical protein
VSCGSIRPSRRRPLQTAGLDPRRSDAHRAHRRRADAAYAIDDTVERDAAFGRLAVREFEELRLAEPILVAIAERPNVARAARVVLVGEAGGRLDEGVTCEAGGAHLGFRVDPARFGNPGDLLGWARHVLGHAEDTLDPGFGFEPGWEEGAGGSIAAATRARLHRLWDVTIDARLATAGFLPDLATLDRRGRIAADLPGVGGRHRPGRAAPGNCPGRPSGPLRLLAVARLASITPRSRADRARCAGSRATTSSPDPAISVLVAADYPDWRPADGLCGRCADRYHFTSRLGGRA